VVCLDSLQDLNFTLFSFEVAKQQQRTVIHFGWWAMALLKMVFSFFWCFIGETTVAGEVVFCHVLVGVFLLLCFFRSLNRGNKLFV